MPVTRFAIRKVMLCFGLAIFAASCGAGCGGGGSPPQTSTAESTAEDKAAQESDSEAPARKSKSKPNTAKKGTKGKAKKAADSPGPHIGEIPRDVWPEIFFDEPLSVYAEKGAAQPVAMSGNAGTTASLNPHPEKANDPVAAIPAKTASAGSGNSWSTIVTGDVLGDETKTIKSSLTEKLQSVGKYSGNYKELRVDAATLAIFAGIANELPDGPSWKPNAKYIRDSAAEIVRSASANGDKYYKPTRAAFDKLDALFSGSKPPGLEDAAESLPFNELVGRTPLMFRMERAFNYLKLSVNTEAAFKKEGAKVAHEGSVLAALAKAVADPSYQDADLDEYQGYARGLQESGMGVVEAVKNSDYPAYTAALDRGSKACTDCHSQYKNN